MGQIVDLCLKKDGLGYQIFNAGNDHNGAIIPTKELAERFFPNVPITRALEEHEALFSNRKIREVLGFKEQHNWRKYVKWDGKNIDMEEKTKENSCFDFCYCFH